ncbi:MAG: hypothetical protein DME38_08620 [Verrucomicrobia bacterium]|nr:MAG: hypothetical protein DME38_08620 [Verrucomicrobiota bacterium]
MEKLVISNRRNDCADRGEEKNVPLGGSFAESAAEPVNRGDYQHNERKPPQPRERRVRIAEGERKLVPEQARRDWEFHNFAP